jgi:DNA-binding beta-propeller fold protein YncE
MLFVLLLGLSPFFGDHAAFAAKAKSDYNRDGHVDLQDVELFSVKWLDQNWQDVDWCLWLQGDHKSKEHLGAELEQFIVDYFGCGSGPGEDPWKVIHDNEYPSRLVWGPSGYLYVTDAQMGSVFIYDPNMVIAGELKGLGTPFGLYVDAAGKIYVGSDKKDVIEIYNPQGIKIGEMGKGLIKMPNDIASDNDGRLYVVDSKSNTIWVFDANDAILMSIGKGGDGEGEFDFPVAAEVAYYTDANGQEIGELFVADQGHYLVKVFDLNGNFLRSYGGAPEKGGMMGTTWYWKGKFVKVQSLSVDSSGYLHALDCYMNRVQILDPVTGGYINSYGAEGSGDDEFKLPFDILFDGLGNTFISDTQNHRIEIITIP